MIRSPLHEQMHSGRMLMTSAGGTGRLTQPLPSVRAMCCASPGGPASPCFTKLVLVAVDGLDRARSAGAHTWQS